MDDFFLRALLGGIGVAVAAGPVGCFIVWRRMVYFGAALAHSALLGVALGFLLGVDLSAGIFALCVLLALLFVPQFMDTLPIFGEEVTVAFAAVGLNLEFAAPTIQVPALSNAYDHFEGFTSREAATPESEIEPGIHPAIGQGFEILKEPRVSRI